MSRSAGTFPRYTKLEIDPEEWPANYFDSSRHCEVCEMHWPTSHLFSVCPKCSEETKLDDHNSPDIRWPDAVKELLMARFDEFYDRYNEGLTDEQLAWGDAKKEGYDFEALEADVEELRTKAA